MNYLGIPKPPERRPPSVLPKAISPALTMAQSTDVARPRVSLLGLLVGGALIGAFSYQAGKAMAPSASKRTAWGWWGVLLGLFTGPVGLGAMGIASLRRK
jgi:hypothetical protein